MNTNTLSDYEFVKNPFDPFEWPKVIPVNTNTFADIFVDLSNTVIERFVLQAPNRLDTMIHSLHSNEFELKTPMPVAIELIDDDEAIAIFEHGNIEISGESPAHAIDELRHYVIGLYDVLRRERQNLGPIPRRQLATLEAYIGKARRE